jgi:hypothetical protein
MMESIENVWSLCSQRSESISFPSLRAKSIYDGAELLLVSQCSMLYLYMHGERIVSMPMISIVH